MTLPLDGLAVTVGLAPGTAVSSEHAARVGPEFVRAVDALLTRCAHTPVTVLVSLSTPAELQVAEAAKARGWPVAACLDRTAAEVEAGFEAALRGRVRAMLEYACVYEIGPAAGACAAFIAAYSHVLVSFEIDSEALITASGAAAETPVTGAGAALGLPELGPLYRVMFDDRSGDASPPAAKIFPQRFTGDVLFEADFAEALARLETFNRDLAASSRAAQPVLTLDDLMARCDSIALRLQNTTYRFLYVLYTIAILATAAQYVFTAVLAYPMLALAFVAYRVAKRFDYENRYQDYRALAEAIRVQRAFFGARIVDDRVDDCYLGMQQRELLWIRMALRYVHLVTRETAGRATDESVCRAWVDEQRDYFKRKPGQLRAALDRLATVSRVAFFTSAIASTAIFAYLYLPTAPHAIAALLDARAAAGATWPLAPGFVASLGHAVAGVQQSWNGSWLFTAPWVRALHEWDVGRPPSPRSPHHVLLVRLSTALLTLYAAIALLLSNYSEKRGYALNVKRYDRMFVVFDRAARQLETLPSVRGPEGARLVRDLGRAALIENADWLLVRRERPLELVTTR